VHATSSGRVLLATMDPERARRLRQQQIPVFTDRTITDFEEIEKRVELARQEGFSVQRGETAPGLGVISAPVYGRGGQPLGTLGLAFPSHVVPTQQEPQLIDALHGACRVLSQRVGCTVYPHGHAAVAH
jgi:DNA-binding IclR family transcriptional regulator